MDETMLKMCGGGMLPMIDFEWNDKLGNLKGTVVFFFFFFFKENSVEFNGLLIYREWLLTRFRVSALPVIT